MNQFELTNEMGEQTPPEGNEREAAQAFLLWIENNIKDLPLNHPRCEEISDDEFEDFRGYIQGKYDEEIEKLQNQKAFTIELSYKERQMLEYVMLFVERELNRLSKVGRPKDAIPSKAALKMRKSRAKSKLAETEKASKLK